MPLYTHPDEGRVYACPECDTAGKMRERVGSNRQGSERFKCDECDHRFDDPTERKASDPAYDSDDLPRALDSDIKAAIKEATR